MYHKVPSAHTRARNNYDNEYHSDLSLRGYPLHGVLDL